MVGRSVRPVSSRHFVTQLRLAPVATCALALCVLPSVAFACAGCMNDDPIWQRKFPILLGFIAFPFLLFGVVYLAIRRHVGTAPRPSHAPGLSKIQE